VASLLSGASRIVLEITETAGPGALPEDQAIVRSIVAIATELGKQTVAEGVEDEHTLRLLYEYGVDQAQGYLLGRPQPVSEPAAAA
jgi:EAL domain-containing protein (putative c-di-GMP-specific phosphodiesterase class I)